ncbi:structural maintenance of chromosomes protein 4 [Cydia fagiglandana]|uniref:structural maintenance of chromosomes protein 4 n=1 Tax=Cydia fagiglandana TaxID=1458189 RepID=UPI002FEE3C7D
MTTNRKKKGNAEPMEVDEVDENTNVVTNGGTDPSDQEFLIDGDLDRVSEDEEGGIRMGGVYIPPAPKPACTFDATGPRLIITHIVNENFKSYAGVQTLGPFHKSFTAIIGPNGSGKSNVIDSMLFVFGYRATKIRSKKISVLLHKSSKHPNITSASVAVHFCQIIDGEGEDFTVVPNSEIVVSRTAFSNNSSYYTLNGRKVQFKEVGKMLNSHGIDLDHNRFLILQGEVEQIAMMKPKAQTEHESGMLEYLEDIIGTSRYKVPLEQLLVKVEEFSELRKEKLNRVRLVEAEKAQLEAPMREAVEQMNLTNVVVRTRNTLLQKYIHETNKLIEGKTQLLNELLAALAEIEGKVNTAQENLNEKTAVLSNGTKKYDDLSKKKEEFSQKLSVCKKKTVTTQADITQGNKKKKNLETLIEQEKGKLIELELVPEKNAKEIEDCESLLARHRENKVKAEEELQTVMASVRSKTQGLQETKDKLQAKMIELKRIVDEANKDFKLRESELKIYLSTETKETEKLERMKESYEKAARDLTEKKSLQEELASTVPTNEKQLTDLQSQLRNMKQEETTVLTEARTLRAQLEESRAALNANRSRGRVLDSLMNEKKKGKMPGIFGRLGDLGGIDPKYDVAISTCCGPLDNIVVDTVKTAQAALDHLRRHDIGRATCITLEKIQHLDYQTKKTFPENVPRLFDLITVRDERMLPAFYFALRDTLVADSLDQARRIAYGRQRHRVVTLAGEVIEISGTMSGGGRTMSRGRMGSSVQQDTNEQDPRVLKANEERLAALEERLTALRGEHSVIEENVVSLQRGTREGKSTLNKLNFELKSLAEQVPLLQNQVRQQETKAASSRVDEAQKARLEAAVEEAKEKLDKAKRDAGEVEKEVHGVDAQIAAVAGGKVKELQKSVDDLSKKIDKVSSEITKLRVAINTSKRNAKKSKDKIAQMEADLTENERKLETWNSEKKQLTLDSAELQKFIEELDEQISDGTDAFSELKKEIAGLQAKLNKYKSEQIEAKNNVTKMEKSIVDFRAKMPQLERDLRNLKLEDPGIEGVPGIEPPDPLATHTAEELEEMAVDQLRERLTAQQGRLGDAKPNLQAIQDYKAKEELYLKRAAELDQITAQRNEVRNGYDQLKKRRTNDFLAGFNTITAKLKEMYQMITLGGDAELELVDTLDPFTEGITFSVRPPNKSWKNISNLSGGEKTLSSLALVFALHYYKPTPLYVMDEIDAALDFKNVSIVANYIKERTKNAQFIIISLRYNMFEVSNRLVGIYKTEDCTKSLTIENKLPEKPHEDIAVS